MMDVSGLVAVQCVLNITFLAASITRLTSMTEWSVFEGSETFLEKDAVRLAKHRAILQWYSIHRDDSGARDKAAFVEAAVALANAERLQRITTLNTDVQDLLAKRIPRLKLTIRHTFALTLALLAQAPLYIPMSSRCMVPGQFTRSAAVLEEYAPWLENQAPVCFAVAWAAMVASYVLLIRFSASQKQLLEDAKEVKELLLKDSPMDSSEGKN